MNALRCAPRHPLTGRPNLPFRQVHLDFHNHGSLEGIGAGFSPTEFAGTLARAAVDSINLFARCHHGYLYYDSKRFPERIHPHLRRNLLAEQINACHEQGIRTPVYLSVQWDAFSAEEHPEWLVRAPDGKVDVPAYEPGFYNFLCLNSPYEQFLRALVSEILETFPADGLWFDILLPVDCSCRHCRELMQAAGLDPADPDCRQRFGLDTIRRFKLEMSALVRGSHPELLVFFNSGHVGPGIRRELDAFSHLEIESLPSGQWGYSHFPATVRYARTLGKQYLGMTGKFHTTWGDFHSFKNPEALAFECFSMLANGARCCIGDQLHPGGKICPHTYDLIGSVFREVRDREPWCRDARPVADIGVLTPEEFTGKGTFSSIPKAIVGAVRLLQELHHQFDIIDSSSDLSAYRLLILPDEVPVDEALAEQIRGHLARGGALLASHRSGLDPAGNRFVLPMGVSYAGQSEFTPTFVRPREALRSDLPPTGHVIYLTGSSVLADEGSETFADSLEPYFNRTWSHYCSHLHAPSSGKIAGPAVVRAGQTVYFSHPLFSQYAANAPRWCRTLVRNAIALVLQDPLLRIAAPPTLVAIVNEQKDRLLLHLLHYIPVRNNDTIDVVDAVIPLHRVEASLRVDRPVEKISCVPENVPVPFRQEAGRVSFVVPAIKGFQIVCIQFAS